MKSLTLNIDCGQETCGKCHYLRPHGRYNQYCDLFFDICCGRRLEKCREAEEAFDGD